MTQDAQNRVKSLLNTIDLFIEADNYSESAWTYNALCVGVELEVFILYVSAFRGRVCHVID